MSAIPTFDAKRLELIRGGAKSRAVNWLADYPQRQILSGVFEPLLRASGLKLIRRHDQVREVFTRDAEFPVPWTERMERITLGENFVLGMPRGDVYDRSYGQIASAWKREDIRDHVLRLSAQRSAEILDGVHHLDAVGDLIWRVPAYLCERYYGIPIDDERRFAAATLAMSSYVFGSPTKEPPADEVRLAFDAAEYFRSLARDGIRKPVDGSLVLPRLIAMKPALSDAAIEAHLFGMVTGLIPTNTLAAGNILATLFKRPQFMLRATEAALRDDDDLLWRILRETLRFRHINLGAFRRCKGDYVLGAGTRYERKLRENDIVVASTQFAMFDRDSVAHPHRFDDQRPADDYLIFGYGQHWCAGSHIASTQVTQTLKALLRKANLRLASGSKGKMTRIGIFPETLFVEYDP